MGKNRRSGRVPPMPNIPGGATLLDKSRSLPEVPPDIPWDPENPLVVNSCCGHSDIHADDCEGDCDTSVMEEYDIKIENEKRAWARLGMDTQHYNANQLRQDVQIQTLIKLMQKKLFISDDEFNEVFKPAMLELLQGVRHAQEEAIERMNSSKLVAITPTKPLH